MSAIPAPSPLWDQTGAPPREAPEPAGAFRSPDAHRPARTMIPASARKNHCVNTPHGPARMRPLPAPRAAASAARCGLADGPALHDRAHDPRCGLAPALPHAPGSALPGGPGTAVHDRARRSGAEDMRAAHCPILEAPPACRRCATAHCAILSRRGPWAAVHRWGAAAEQAAPVHVFQAAAGARGDQDRAVASLLWPPAAWRAKMGLASTTAAAPAAAVPHPPGLLATALLEEARSGAAAQTRRGLPREGAVQSAEFLAVAAGACSP